MESWKARDFAILQGVGYPYPEPLALPLDRDLGHRVGREPDAERGLDRPGLPGHQPAQGRRRRRHRGRHQRAAADRPVAAHHRHAGCRELPAPGRGDEGDGAARRDGGNPALRHLLAVRQEINAAAAGLRDRLRAAPQPAYRLQPGHRPRPPARSRDAPADGARAGGRHQGGAGRLRHPRQPGADARAAARRARRQPRDAAQEPDRRRACGTTCW